MGAVAVTISAYNSLMFSLTLKLSIPSATVQQNNSYDMELLQQNKNYGILATFISSRMRMLTKA